MANPVVSDILTFGQRDLLDYITLVDMKDTPFFTLLPKGSTPDAVTVEWPVDNQVAPTSAINAGAVDGTDISDFDSYQDDYAILSNKVQWFRNAVMIGEMAETVQNQAGIPRQRAYAIKKKMEQLKRQVEIRISGDDEMQAPTGTNPSQFRGIGKWIQATAQSVSPVPTAHLVPTASVYTGTLAALTETNLQAVLTSQYSVTGQTRTRQLIVGTSLKQNFTSYIRTQTSSANVMSSARFFTAPVDAKKIVNTVDVYVGDFGTYELLPSLWLNYSFTTNLGDIRRGYAIDTERWQLSFVHPMKIKELPDNGGGERFMVHTKLTLKGLNPRDQAKFASAS